VANFGRCCAIFYSEVISFRAVMKPEKMPHARLEVVKVQSAHMPSPRLPSLGPFDHLSGALT
jgi:hypothetical protein